MEKSISADSDMRSLHIGQYRYRYKKMCIKEVFNIMDWILALGRLQRIYIYIKNVEKRSVNFSN